MKQNNFKFDYVSDKELLDKTLSYLIHLRPLLPFSRLRDHCSGAIASLFELVYYLNSRKIVDYGNYKK